MLVRFIAMALLGSALAACSSTVASSPAPTETPVSTMCRGAVIGGGAQVPIVVTTRTNEGAYYQPAGKLQVSPTTIVLSPAHPQQRVAILQARFNGVFTIAFQNCGSSAPSVRFTPSDHGPRTTAIVSLP
ncbi:MAG: hypothetical protein WB681_05645 [Candidatus Cybelea sp.]